MDLGEDFPEDIWDATFDISSNGNANVEYDIMMSVPKGSDRPFDYLNFGHNVSEFEAFDSESNEPLRIDIMEKKTGKLVIVIPRIRLKRGDVYHYRLKFKQKGLLTKNNDCYFLSWGWGNWPLKYNLKFILPENGVVYQTSPNLVASRIKNNRPILVFKDESKSNTAINIYGNFFLGDKSAIEFTEWRTRNPKESDTYEIDIDIRNEKDVKMIVNVSSPLPSNPNQKWIDRPLRGTIDNPIQIIINDVDAKLKIFEKNSEKLLKAKILPILFGGKGIQETLRIYFSNSQITSYFSNSQITSRELNWVIESERTDDLGLIKKINNVFRFQWIGSEQQFINYRVKCTFPPDVLLFSASPNLSESKIENNRPILIFNEKSNYFTSLNVEALFIQDSKALINFDTLCSKCYYSSEFCNDITKKILSEECENFMDCYK